MIKNFFDRLQKLLGRDDYFDIDHVRGVLSLHHWQCVFEIGAPEQIVQRLSRRTRWQWLDGISQDPEIREEFKRCFALSEIYCPHEGIDRRAEYGINPGALQ